MSEIPQLSNEIKESLRISKVFTTNNNNKVFVFQLGCFDAVLRFFLIWIFTLGNILIALGELIAIALNQFPEGIEFVPLIHLLLLLLPYFLLRDMPPKGLEVDDEQLKIAFRKIFRGYRYKNIKLSKVDHLKTYLTNYKGTIRTEIRVIMASGKSELIFKTRISDESRHKLISDFFADLLSKEIIE